MADGVLVVGELNVDLVVSGLSSFPMVGKESLAQNMDLVLGSSSAICASGIARLGARVDLVSKVGVDHYGDVAVEELRRSNVGTGHVVRDKELRTGVTISLNLGFDRALVTYLGSIPLVRMEDVPLGILPLYQHLHVGSFFLQEQLRPQLPELFRRAHAAGMTVSLDTGCDPNRKWGGAELFDLLQLVDLFIPNEDEARSITHNSDTARALRELARHARLVVVKCGSHGAVSWCDGRLVRSPGFRVNTVDTTGAGDSFNAGLIFAHVIRGMPIEEAIAFANACGALSTTGFGGTSAQPTLQQVQALLEKPS